MDKALPRAIAAAYDSPCERTLDVVQLDYYDPEMGGRIMTAAGS